MVVSLMRFTISDANPSCMPPGINFCDELVRLLAMFQYFLKQLWVGFHKRLNIACDKHREYVNYLLEILELL